MVGTVLDQIRDRKFATLPDAAAQLAEAVKSRSVCFAKVRPPADTLGLDPLMRFIADYGRGFERLGDAVPTVVQLVADSETTEIVTHPPDLYGDEMIGQFPAATFDQHTREGKHAIAYFKACLRTEFTFHQIAWAVFVVEGQFINVELLFDGADALRIESIEAGFHKRGIVTRDQMLDVTELVRANRELLNRARRRVIEAG